MYGNNSSGEDLLDADKFQLKSVYVEMFLLVGAETNYIKCLDISKGGMLSDLTLF